MSCSFSGNIDFKQQSLLPFNDETHGGEDVAIYARGPMSHLLHGVVEEHYVAHMMGYASCVGENKDHCKWKPKPNIPVCRPSGANQNQFNIWFWLITFIISMYCR